MKKLTQEELNKVLDLHKKWLNNEEGGRRASLSGADLAGIDLFEVNLFGANLSEANLHKANLRGSNLRGANLIGANLTKANLSGVNLTGADLIGANLAGAYLAETDLAGADLTGANLTRAWLIKAQLGWTDFSGADLTGAKLPDFQIPQDVDLEVWKKIEEDTLVKLRIPKEAKRTACLINNKCRAEYAEVLEIIGEGRCSMHDPNFVYEVGKIVKPTSYSDDIREDCMPGIHFFMTKEEAEGYY